MTPSGVNSVCNHSRDKKKSEHYLLYQLIYCCKFPVHSTMILTQFERTKPVFLLKLHSSKFCFRFDRFYPFLLLVFFVKFSRHDGKVPFCTFFINDNVNVWIDVNMFWPHQELWRKRFLQTLDGNVSWIKEQKSTFGIKLLTLTFSTPCYFICISFVIL